MVTELTYDLDSLKTALGASAAFRTWVNESTQANARTHVYLFSGAVGDPPTVTLAHGPGWRRDVSDLGTDFGTQPVISAVFTNICTKTDSNETVFSALLTSISAIMADLESQTAYRIDAWYPDSEEDPVRGKESAGQDWVAAKIIIEGNIR
jgi:hypothetical protein